MTKNNYNDTVFDALLKKAVIENFERELSDISDGELALKYTFSERHEERMRRLFKREQTKQYLRQFLTATRRIAAVFIIGVALVFSLLMFNEGVRAEVKKVIIQWYEKFTSFTFTGEGQADTFEWRPAYLPDGFAETDVSEYGESVLIVYTSTDGTEILLNYSKAQDSLNFSVDNEQRAIETISLNGKDAFILTALYPDIENGLIWQNDGYAFDIWSLLDADELLKIAESVELKK